MREVLKRKISKTALITDPAQVPEGSKWIFDFRPLLLQPESLEHIATELLTQIPHKSFQIGGMESAAIPIITALMQAAHADGRSVTAFYVRKSRKKSGFYKAIEGNVTNEPIVLVDDLINSGSSIKKILAVLDRAQKKVSALVTIVRFRDDNAYTFLTERSIELRSLFHIDDFNLSLTPEEQYAEAAMDNATRQWVFRSQTSSFAVVTAKSAPTVTDTQVIFGSDDGHVYGLHKSTGDVAWKLKIGYLSRGKAILSSPCVYKDVCLIGAYDGKLYAVDTKTGASVWTSIAAEWIGASPAVATKHDLVVVGLEHALVGARGSIAAFNFETGELRWEFPMPALTHASPLYIAEHDIIVCGGNEGVLYCLAAETGALLWSFETGGGATYNYLYGYSGGDIKLAPAYDRATDTIAFSSMDGHVYTLNRSDGTCLDRFATELTDTDVRIGIYGAPVFTKSHLVFGALDRRIYCYNTSDSSLAWSFETSGRIFATPVCIDGYVFIGANDGALYQLEEKTGRLVSKNIFSDRIVSKIAIEQTEDGYQVYVATDDASLHALSFPSS